MNSLLLFSSALYRVFLVLYPPDVRREFGDEMADVFTQQLADAWLESGMTGAIQVWWLVLSELPAIALPRQLARPALLVPAASVLSSSCIMFSLIWALEHSLLLSAWYHGVFGGGRH